MNNLKVNLEKDKENKKVIKLNLELSYYPKFFSLYILEMRTLYYIILTNKEGIC